ncbi:MAG: IS1595 family transposase [Nitrososphaerales archaeon]|jgi:transposase-like protein
MNLLSVATNFVTEEAAWDYLVKSRWPDGIRCLACDHAKVYQIATQGKTGKPCRLFECAECRLHFSATTGTLFHDSHLPLQKWFMAMALMCEAKKGVSALQIQRHIGTTYKTAWYLCHRIRKAMQELSELLGGQGQIVEIDETFLGGKTRRTTMKEAKERKIKVVGIVERGGRIRLQKAENLKASTLREIYQQNVSPGATVVTDGSPTYRFVVPEEKHIATDHSQEIRETGSVSMKTVEGAFSLFKRGVVGSYHHLSKDHLDSYLGEFSWRYNRRKMQPWMFQTLLRELVTKKPMTYKTLTRDVF